jgi:transcription elongation factor GreA
MRASADREPPLLMMNDPSALLDHQGGIPLTPDGHARLQKELDDLTSKKRPEIADRIRESQQHGEFSEDNNELDEVKLEQAMVENRIADLKALFGNSYILEDDMIPTDRVGIGSLTTVEDLQYGDTFEVRLVSSVEADPSRDMVSTESPIGEALFGHGPDDVVSFEAPEGTKKYRVLSITR